METIYIKIHATIDKKLGDGIAPSFQLRDCCQATLYKLRIIYRLPHTRVPYQMGTGGSFPGGIAAGA
jgi:hypothetical protein